jgi:hypothetical protein
VEEALSAVLPRAKGSKKGAAVATAVIVVAALVMGDIPTTYLPSDGSRGGKGGESSRSTGSGFL